MRQARSGATACGGNFITPNMGYYDNSYFVFFSIGTAIGQFIFEKFIKKNTLKASIGRSIFQGVFVGFFMWLILHRA